MSGISSERLRNVDDALLKAQLVREWEAAYGSLKRHEAVQKAKMIGREAMKWVLALAMLGGLVTVVVVAPKIFTLVEHGRRIYVHDRRFRDRLCYMRRQRYITFDGKSDVLSIRLSERGKFWLLRELLRSSFAKEKQVKDGKLRIVMFDIPRRHNAARNALRAHFRRMGMEKLQNSVYLARFACEKEVAFLTNIWSVSGSVSIAYADTIEQVV